MPMSEFLRVASAPLEGRTGHDAGRALLAQMYRQQFGKEMPEIAAGPWGKPYFVDESACFSISHTKSRVSCALSSTPVGMDAEETERPIAPKLAEKILSASEYAQYAVSQNKNRALLKFWVLKEAAGKLSGKGVQPYPNHTAFSLDDPRVTEEHGHYVAVMTA